jgi:transposase
VNQRTAAIIRALETDDCTKREIAARFGISEQRIGQICRENGIVTLQQQRKQAALDDLRETGLSLQAIAAQHGVSYATVQSAGLRAGLAEKPCDRCGRPQRGGGLCSRCEPHVKSALAAELDREFFMQKPRLLELFTAHDFEGATAATGFAATVDYLLVYESAGLTVFSDEPGDYVLMYHAAKRAFEWAAGQRATAVYLHAPGPLYRELNRLAKPVDPVLWLETWNLCRSLGAQVIQAGNLHPQRRIAEKVAALLTEHAQPQPEPEAEILARLLRDRYPGELLRQVAALL